MKTKEQIDKMPLDKYIFWLNSMTTAELHKEFPGEFNKLKAGDSQGETVKNMLANDAILWRFVKTHAQKLASELTEKESEVRTEEEILEKYLQPNFNISNTEIKEYHRFISIEDAIKAMHEFASQLQQPEITDENLIIKIRRILVDYHRRDDYDLTKAENDMLCLFRNTFVSPKEQPSDEDNERLQNGRHYLMGVEPKDLTVEDALEAFGFGRNGLKD